MILTCTLSFRLGLRMLIHGLLFILVLIVSLHEDLRSVIRKVFRELFLFSDILFGVKGLLPLILLFHCFFSQCASLKLLQVAFFS